MSVSSYFLLCLRIYKSLFPTILLGRMIKDMDIAVLTRSGQGAGWRSATGWSNKYSYFTEIIVSIYWAPSADGGVCTQAEALIPLPSAGSVGGWQPWNESFSRDCSHLKAATSQGQPIPNAWWMKGNKALPLCLDAGHFKKAIGVLELRIDWLHVWWLHCG